MVTTEDFVLGGLGLVAGILYGAVAWIQSRRVVSSESRGPLRSFVIYWVGLAAVSLMVLYFRFGPDLSTSGIHTIRAVIYVLFLLIFVAFGGLVHYLLFLYTGRPKVKLFAYGFYAFMFIFLVWLIEAHAPHIAMGHPGTPQEGAVEFHLHEDPATWASAVFSLGFVLPIFGSSVAYALLFFRTDDVTSRYRIALVSGGFVLWYAYSLFNSIASVLNDGQEQSFANQVLGQVLGVLAATLTLLAYDPPKWVVKKLGVRELADSRRRDELPAYRPRVEPA